MLDPPAAARRRAGSGTRVQAAVALVAIISALGTSAVRVAPTAWRPADVAVAAVAGAVVALLGAWSSRRARLVVAGALLLGAWGSWAMVGAAAGLAIVAAVAPDRDGGRWASGAVFGAGAVQVLLHLPRERTGLNVLIALLVVGLLAWSAAPRATVAQRVRAGRALRWVGGVLGLVVLGFAVAVVLARRDLERGVDRVEAGLEAVRDGRGEDAAELLDAAARDLEDARGHLDAWWARPALGVPVLGPQAEALAGLSEQGALLAASGAQAVREAGIDDLRVVDGRVDLEQVRSMAAPLESVRVDLRSSRAALRDLRSPWLVGPVAGGVHSLERSIEGADRDAATASQAVAVLPELLGGQGERRYLVAFGTPAETRELGGFMGAYAILAARDGDLELVESDRVLTLNRAFKGAQLSDPDRFPASYLAMLPQRFWHNLTATPDFPTMAEAVRQLHRPPRAEALDGVLYMDPQTLAALLRLTGPIRLDGYDQPLTARNAARFLLQEQYTEFPGDDRHEFLADAAEQVFEELTTGTLPEPGEVADALASSVAGRRLLAHSYHPDEQALFEQLGIDGSLPPVRGDLLTVRSQNRGLNKIDALLRRTLHYEVSSDPSGAGITARLTVTLHNDAPASGLPHSIIGNRLGEPDGTSSTSLAVYSPLDLVAVTEGGQPLGVAASPEYGIHRYAVLLDLPPGAARTITFELAGPLDLTRGYHLDVVPQPLATPDRLTVVLDLPFFGKVTPVDDRRLVRTFSVGSTDAR